MMQLILCCLVGLSLTLVSAAPPENCPDDYDATCRTDYRYRVGHDWIPYANASSGNGVRWRVLVDQHDYQNIFGQFNIPPGKWKANDVDGDGLNWVHGGGGTCTYQIRTNSYRRPNSNNWYFTQALSYCDAVELVVNASVRFSACTQRPNCDHDYVYLHRFDTNSPNEGERIKPENYDYILGNEEDSKLKQDGTTGGTQIIKYFQRPDTSHTYLGIQDIGTIGQVQRLMVYYKVCQKNQAGLAIYPEVPLPPHTSGSSDRIMRPARCVAHAHNITSLETYAYIDQCVQNVECECDAGYERSADSTECVPCTKGYYKSSQNSTCVPCPKNTKSDIEGADHCECINGYYRAPNEGVGMICTAPPGPIPNTLRIVSMCDTTAELAWDRPGEVGRDDFYYAINRTSPDSSEEIMLDTRYIDDSDIVTFTVTGLVPKTTYTFSVCVHNGVSQFDQINDKLRVVAQQATTKQGSVFMHNNMELSNNSVVLREEIGEGDKALICQTLSDAECGSSALPAMFFPNKTEVLPAGNGRTMYSTTGTGQVRLNRKPEDKSPLGLYYCQIPDSEGNTQKMFVKIATMKQESPTCPPLPLPCPELEVPTNGEVNITSSNVGSTATYTCNTGFELVGQRSRSCQSSGIWSGTAPTCRSVDCGGLPQPANGQINLSSTTYHSTASYTCTSGYNLIGTRVRTCEANGEWSGAAPVCVPISPTTPPITTTTTPPPAPGGLRFELNGNTYSNGSMVFIDDIGVGNDALLCYTSRLDCCSGGNRYGEFYYPDGTLVGIRSNNEPMYRNRGSQLIRLNRNSNSPSLPPSGWYRCEIPSASGVVQSISINIKASGLCPPLSDPIGGSVTIPAGSLVPGSMATYLCNVGRQLIGSANRECQDDGTWSESEPTCETITCPVLSPPDNGRVTQLGNTPGSLAIYSCTGNYELSSGSQLTCGSDGQWEGVVPSCQLRVTSCPALEHPDRGLVTLGGNSPGSVATYSCNGGHSLLGSATRQCQSDGTWSNEPPTCINVGFQLNGQFYASGSSLSLSSIGEGGAALLCVTDGNCCNPPNRAGEFYYPDGSPVRTEGTGDDFYRNRGAGMIRLNRRNDATSPTGTYKCAIPDSSGVTQEIFITLN